MKSALSLKLNEKNLLVVDSLEVKEPKTKGAAALMGNLKVDSALFVDLRENKNLFLSLRNIPKVKAVDAAQLNVYDVLNYRWIVFTKRAFDSITEKLK